MGGLWLPAPADHGYRAPACWAHATDAEQAEHQAVAARAAAFSDEFQRSLPVACHGWAVPADVAERARLAATHAERWGVLQEWQDTRCAVCGARESFVEDHDHGTGMVRGLLCRSCNGQEPGGGDRFVRYRARPPVAILGLAIRYTGIWAEYGAGHGEQ